MFRESLLADDLDRAWNFGSLVLAQENLAQNAGATLIFHSVVLNEVFDPFEGSLRLEA